MRKSGPFLGRFYFELPLLKKCCYNHAPFCMGVVQVKKHRNPSGLLVVE